MKQNNNAINAPPFCYFRMLAMFFEEANSSDYCDDQLLYQRFGIFEDKVRRRMGIVIRKMWRYFVDDVKRLEEDVRTDGSDEA